MFFLLCIFAQPLYAQCDQPQDTFKVALLLPLDDLEYPFVQSFVDGAMSGNLVSIEEQCTYIEWVEYPTTQEGELFIQQWYKLLNDQPDMLIGPLLPQNQQQLADLDLSQFPKGIEWLYPGDAKQLSLPDDVNLVNFSLGQAALVRSLLEYAWDQGQHDLVLLLSDDDLGRSIGKRVESIWDERGGAVVAVEYYSNTFGGLSRSLRQLIDRSDGQFDLLLGVLDEQRLRMIRPLMDYYSREEPVYLLTPPVGEIELQKDLRDLYFPLSPELLSRSEKVFDVDDFLLQMEFLGEDLMVMLRSGHWQQLKKTGSYFGKAGRYRIEQGQLLRDLCIATTSRRGFERVYCPEPDELHEIGVE